mgnify:CR=1 FL=1
MVSSSSFSRLLASDTTILPSEVTVQSLSPHIYFSKDGVVSEESIREQVQVWNEKLKNAGMDTLIEQISANKK